MDSALLPWTRKHQPSSLKEVRGQDAALLSLRKYVSGFSPKRPKAALLYGPSGCGKTCSAYALASELALEVVDINASDTRTKAALNGVLGSAMKQRSLFSQGKLILIDEIDGLSGNGDRGGPGAIASLIAESAFPVLLTANDPWDKRFADLRKKATLIRFEAPEHDAVKGVLTDIARKESITVEPAALERLSRRSAGDLRAAICDMQLLSSGTGTLTSAALEALDSRDRQGAMEDALVRIFRGSDPALALAAFDSVDEDLDTCLQWVHENLASEYDAPEDRWRGYDALSKADVFRGRVFRRQDYRLELYVRSMLTMGVALAKDRRSTRPLSYMRPTVGLEIWKYRRANALRDAVCQRLAEQTHTSRRVARLDSLPYLRPMFRSPLSDGARNLSLGLEMSEEEVAWLGGR